MIRFNSKKTINTVLLPLIIIAISGCMPGAMIDKGGSIHTLQISPGATMTGGAPFVYICPDYTEINRRKALEKSGAETFENKAPPVKKVNPEDYNGSCRVEGESSQFFLFNMFPAAGSINAAYAISQAVQKMEGDTMINLQEWHETHYYSILGRVAVYKVTGDVIQFIQPGR